MKKILGIDPGTCKTGYALIEVHRSQQHLVDYGTIRLPTKFSLPERLRILHESLGTLIQTYAPNELAVEAQYMDKNVQSVLKLGMAKGIAFLAASLREIPVFEYAPSKAKLAVTGSGKASKYQVQQMLMRLFEIAEPQEDAADALAIALCHIHHRR